MKKKYANQGDKFLKLNMFGTLCHSEPKVSKRRGRGKRLMDKRSWKFFYKSVKYQKLHFLNLVQYGVCVFLINKAWQLLEKYSRFFHGLLHKVRYRTQSVHVSVVYFDEQGRAFFAWESRNQILLKRALLQFSLLNFRWISAQFLEKSQLQV